MSKRRGSEEHDANPLRIWLLPFSLLAGLAALVFAVTYYLDASGDGNPPHALSLFFTPNPASAANTLSNAGEISSSVLAIAITVVAIVVELAANRYTHRITELFISEPTNFAVMGFFVVTALQSLFVTLVFDYDATTGTGFVPHLGIVVSMTMLALCLLILLPYFRFVFVFLNPIHILARIRAHTVEIIDRQRGTIAAKQAEAVRGIEQIADVGLNAMEHKDKGVSMASVDALMELVVEYETFRKRLSGPWFRVEGDLAHNADFVSMSEEVLESVSGRRIWLEMKVLRQYQTIYNEALNKMRDINYIIAINTRRIAENAMKHENDELLDLVIKFFNTYLRATINARDVRTAYNVLNQYRLLAEAALVYKSGSRATEIARYFKYYGQLSFQGKLPFILETVAYDLCELIELAFDKKSPLQRELLRIFLEVDKESESEIQEASLRGVRKAQLKLATYYLIRGDETFAREVFHDMESEKAERLGSIRDELLRVRTAEFWEISDRGQNFDYLTPDRKEQLLRFFEWFGDRLPPLRVTQMVMSEPPPAMGGASTSGTNAGTGKMRVDSLHDVPGGGADPAKPEP